MSDPGQGAAGVAAVPDLYVSDVDHTLLDSAGTLSDYSRATLNRLLAQGLRFTVASARLCRLGNLRDGLRDQVSVSPSSDAGVACWSYRGRLTGATRTRSAATASRTHTHPAGTG